MVAGPDHLAAVAPLAVREHRGTWKGGARWGLGHSAGVGLVGLLAFALRQSLPQDRVHGWTEQISTWSERLVGVMLIGIGLWALRRVLQVEVHAHRHAHDGSEHEHVHFHGPGHQHGGAEAHGVGRGHPHAAFGIGTLHGLAGSSHLVGVLPTLGFADWGSAAGYLGGFALGTVLAMVGFSTVLGLLGRWFSGSHRGLYQGLARGSALAAIGVGCWWVWLGM